MITIKKDRGWEKLESWEDIKSLPGYVRDIDPKAVKMEAVIGKYREPELRVCGLSNWHTKHFRGYLVSTIDGRVTNIGVDCGKNHFGVDFEIMSRQLDRDWQNQEHRESILSAKNRLDEWSSNCHRLLNDEHGASWLYKQHKSLMNFEKGLPEIIARKLKELMKNGNNILTRERAATKQEKEIAKETGQKMAAVIIEEVGVIKGLNGLSNIDELRSLLPKDLVPNLEVLKDINVTNASENDLRYWSKWCGEVDDKIAEASLIIEDARKFFAIENISMFTEIAESRNEEKSVMRIARHYK